MKTHIRFVDHGRGASRGHDAMSVGHCQVAQSGVTLIHPFTSSRLSDRRLPFIRSKTFFSQRRGTNLLVYTE